MFTDGQYLTARRDGLQALGVPASCVYVDHGLTRTNRDRPGLKEVMERATPRSSPSSTAWLLFNVLAMVAEFEADLIRMRTRAGMRVATAKGRLRGRQPKLSPKQEAHLAVLALAPPCAVRSL